MVGIVDVALAYRDLGWSIVPQLPGAKKPRVLWKEYQDRIPTQKLIKTWFTRWPTAGLAVVLGPVSNLLVVDVDGPEAHAVLVARLGTEPLAPKVLSGSRAPCRYHLFFQCPDLHTRAKQTPWHENLEFRGQGGIVIIPPSFHKSGRRYAWAKGQSVDDLSPPVVPDEIQEALKPVRRTPRQPATLVEVDFENASRSTKKFLSGAYAEGPRWNDRLFRAACDLAGREVPLDEAEPLLLTGAQPWTRAEAELARGTIQSAYSQQREPGRY